MLDFYVALLMSNQSQSFPLCHARSHIFTLRLLKCFELFYNLQLMNQDQENDENSIVTVEYKDTDELLVDLVRRYEHLYDKSNKNYKDRIMKDNSWVLLFFFSCKYTFINCTPNNITVKLFSSCSSSIILIIFSSREQLLNS